MSTLGHTIKKLFNLGAIIFALCVSLFVGLMLATAGGAIYPPMVNVVAPLICHDKVVAESHSYSYKPGQRGVTRETYCVEPSGQRKDITLAVVGIAFTMYSGIFFGLSLLVVIPTLGWLNRKTTHLQNQVSQTASQWQAQAQETSSTPDTKHVVINLSANKPTAEELATRLKTLRQLHDQNLISEQEYNAKKAELLAEL